MTAEVIANMICAQFLESVQVTGHTSVRSYDLTNCSMLGIRLNIQFGHLK